MPATYHRERSSLPTTSPRRRIISKIASPFTSKSRTIPDFYVQAEDPHKSYSAGDIVRGSVIVKIVKPVRVTHIVVALHGYVQVYKTPNSPPSEGFRAHNSLLGKGRGKKSGEYFGNGFATLFEDEHVVCGDGRLAEGAYRFDFEMIFPKENLPSSIDFERGTISYMLTATMTRPTSISPITFHDQKILYTERIDIATLLPPVPRTITLEPIPRRSRGRKRTATSSDTAKKKDDASSTTAFGRQSIPSSVPSTSVDEGALRSPSPSIESLDSRPDSNCQTSASGSSYRAREPADCGSITNSSCIAEEKTITVTVETLKGGCMRGDSIPLKIVIHHTKHIKSINGVIATLYRHARVDMHPAIPLGPTNEKERGKYEDYYPKSLTGLGGLSLSGVGSSHVFRKDLVQVIMPLMVDPRSMTAEVSPKIRIPENCFPSISTVPGEMISFKYYIEVIVDIQGKLTGQDRYVAQANDPAASFAHYGDQNGRHGLTRGDSNNQLLIDNSIIDTAPIRRDKSVITCIMEVIVGTRDTTPKKAKGKAPVLSQVSWQPQRQETQATNTDQVMPQSHQSRDHSGWYDSGYDYNAYDYGSDQQQWPTNGNYEHYDNEWSNQYDHTELIPPPHIAVDENLTEKERLRNAEALLLPSRPPDSEDPSEETYQPSAPVIPDDHFGSPRDARNSSGPIHDSPDMHSNGAILGGSSSTPVPIHHDSTPTAGATSSSVAPAEAATDDKQELRRRQLELQVSQPPASDREHDEHDASAPSLPPEEELTFPLEQQNSIGQTDHLPRYER